MIKPLGKSSGRAAVDNSWVKDENYEIALFNNMGASPASMQAGTAVDAFGLQPEFDVEQAVAEAAYTLCDLKGTETWVRLPEDGGPMSGSPETLKDIACSICPIQCVC